MKVGTRIKMNSPEYLKDRCCMCPNVGQQIDVCPGILSTPHPDPSPCRFVKMYVDKRGWKYRVMSGIGGNIFKARYQRFGKSGWHSVARLEWRKSFDEAQADLNRLAKENQWDEAQTVVSSKKMPKLLKGCDGSYGICNI